MGLNGSPTDTSCTYDRFDTHAFILCLKKVQKRFGNVVMIAYRALPHYSKALRKFLRRNKDIKIMHFPRDSPHSNVMEKC